MINKIGEWLGSTGGFWFNIGVATLCAPLAWFASYDVATFVLSWVAIVLPAFILKRDHDRDCVAMRRDEAMHQKLDGLVHASEGVSDELEGLEKRV